METLSLEESSIMREAGILNLLTAKKMEGVPKFKKYGVTECGSVYMCIESLGPSLSDLLKFCNGTFSIKTTLMIGKKFLSVLKTLHEHKLLHQDIKP